MERGRSDGLDIFRSVAILSVLIGHSLQHSSPPAWLTRPLGRAGIPGVELFFVLSGFLIGGIIVRLIASDRFRNLSDIGRFWGRRWLRTLPLYYVFLLVFLRVDWRGPFAATQFPEYFVFSQNLFHPTPNFFELSWSLAIEEWFYLLFPLVFLGVSRLVKEPRRCLAIAVIVFLAVPAVLRLTLPHPAPGDDLFGAIRVPVAYRLDSLMYGVLMAIVSVSRPRVWQALQRGFPVFLLLFVGYQVFWIDKMDWFLNTAPGKLTLMPVMSITCALLLPFMAGVSLDRAPIIRGFFGLTSRISYSLYLGHIVVIIFLNQWIFATAARKAAIYDHWFILYPIYLICMYALAYLSYRLIELPFLRLRDFLPATRPETRAAVVS